MASSRPGVGAMNAWRHEVGVRPAAREVARQLADDVAVARGQPERRVAVEGQAVAAGDRLGGGRPSSRARRARAPRARRGSAAWPPRRWAGRTGRCRGRRPAIAVATSQRTNSAPRSIGSASSIRMTGWPAASSAVGQRRRGRRPSAPASAIRTNARSGAVGLDGAERLEVDRDDPDAVLAGALGDELLDPRPERCRSRRRPGTSACRGRPWPASPIARPSETPGLAAGSGSRQAPEHRRGRREQRVEVDPDERRRHEPDVGQRRVAAADVGRVEEDLAEVVVVLDVPRRSARVGDGGEVGAGHARSDGAGPPSSACSARSQA